MSDDSPKKSFWQHAWDVAGFTLVIYAVIAACIVGTGVFLLVADR